MELITGDCLEKMKEMEENSIDTIITDPPYGLKFMSKKWDYDVPSIGIWKEVLRVLKPGGTALIFAGSRTQHRMAVNVEDAGFILKDTIMWLYGSGFPKAHDIALGIDKQYGYSNRGHAIASGSKYHPTTGKARASGEKLDAYKGRTEEGAKWQGWKSHGLKPAYEPILVAVKPNDGTYANNALKWGVSGLNIDGGRIETKDELGRPQAKSQKGVMTMGLKDNGFNNNSTQGRFPANVILDEEAGKMLDEQSGVLKSGEMNSVAKGSQYNVYGKMYKRRVVNPASKSGASRFFYCAKASKKERNMGCEDMEVKEPAYKNHRENYKNTKGIETPFAGTGRSGKDFKNNHPTVKPLKLMEYLCTLTKTPTGGVVLDPFMGSGTTGMACINTGRDFIGIEREKEYVKIAKARIEACRGSKQLKL